MLGSTKSLLGLVLLPFIIYMQIGEIYTGTIIGLGIFYIFSIIYSYINLSNEEKRILKQAKITLDINNKKTININRISKILGIDKNKVFKTLQVFQDKQELPHDVKFIW
jgi:hypothetical protein